MKNKVYRVGRERLLLATVKIIHHQHIALNYARRYQISLKDSRGKMCTSTTKKFSEEWFY